MLAVPEKYRVTEGAGKYNSDSSMGNNGLFHIPLKGKKGKRIFKVLCGEGAGWQHVSVSLPDRTPTWEEMCKIKDLFWNEEARVVQYHPPKSQYKNTHKYCLHLWRPINGNMPFPPAIMV